ncbi:MAG: hypothetical protein E6Q36_00110 [Chryseobacterium sp.]|nr:MAG: hypothetical protein E6Q36_00110 [Chryseobacterium sp.]
MEFIIHFHVKTDQQDKLVQLLHEYSGITPMPVIEATDDLLDMIMADPETEPTYYVVNKGCDGWLNVEYNSFKRLHHLGKKLSAELDTVFLQTVYASVNQYSYFLYYEKGEKKREIEGISVSPDPSINWGELLAFESGENDLSMFDLDSIADYCKRLGIDLSCLQNEEYSIVLKADVIEGDYMYHVERDKLRVLKRIEKDGDRLRIGQ